MSGENYLQAPGNALSVISIYDIHLRTIDGEHIALAQYAGKKILIVNTASECGYTPQYVQLQELHEKFGDKIAVLGIPSNDFGGQEPGTEEEIKSFCDSKYHVTFQLFEKLHVIGPETHPLYKWLSNASENGWNSQAPTWNFCKYLIDEDGHLLNYFGKGVDPLDERITG